MIYEPREDSFLLAAQVKRYCKGKTVLDMGSASGIISETAIKAGAKNTLAVDIQDDVIQGLKMKGIPCLKSDLFEKVKGCFDLIAFNPPYLPEDKREERDSSLTTTGGKEGDETILRFLEQTPEHMEPGALILMVISSLTPRKRIIRALDHLGLKREVTVSDKYFQEVVEVWKIKTINNK